MKKIIAKIVLASVIIAPLAGLFPLVANASPDWDTTGSYVVNFNYLATDYPHDMNLTQDNAGNLTGNGGSPAGSNTYTWVITSGTVSGDTIDFLANYTATPDAVTPQTTMHVTGTIAPDGSMSGTWSDNYQGGQREGTWASVSGVAHPATVHVTVVKFIDGSMATAQSANSAAFGMSATWNAANIGSGTGSFDLDADGFNGDPTLYQAITSEMTTGASYTASEVLTGNTVADTCAEGKPFELIGYSSGDTLSAAQNAAISSTAPNFTNLTSDKVIIVWNGTCPTTGEIHGSKFEDMDGNGRITGREDDHGLAGWTMYLDANNNGTLDSGEASTVTDANGNYQFMNLVPGTYYVREVGQSGWVQTYPAAGSQTVTLTVGHMVMQHKNFANFQPGSISGMKYNDLNRNGRKDTNEPGLQGWTIVLRKTGVGSTTVSTVTDANGNYSFAGLNGGIYLLSEVRQQGWIQLQRPGSVRITSGTNATQKNFGNHQR